MTGHNKMIAIVGGSGAGKSTLVAHLVRQLSAWSCLKLMADDYYRDLRHLSPSERNNRNFDHPDAIDWALMAEHLQQLRHGQSIACPIYDFATHTRQGSRELKPAQLVFIDGIMVTGQRELSHLIDLNIFVDTPPDLRFIRRLRRDVKERGRDTEGVIEQYLRTVRPMHYQFVEPLKALANHVVDWTETSESEVAAAAKCVAQLMH